MDPPSWPDRIQYCEFVAVAHGTPPCTIIPNRGINLDSGLRDSHVNACSECDSDPRMRGISHVMHMNIIVHEHLLTWGVERH
jgi:hypothetical protein